MARETPAEKKKRIQERNKRHNLINLMAEQHEANRQAALELDEARKHEREKHEPEAETVWSARVGEVRNRLTGSRRQADERWNRFVATSGAGARGR